MRWLFKLLYPGLGIKRWLVLLLAGFSLFTISLVSVSFAFPHIFSVPSSPLRYVKAWSAAGPVYAVLVAGIGLVLMGWAVIRLVRSLVVDLAPGNDQVVDSLYQVRYLRRGPRVVVMGGGTGLSTLLRGLKHYTSNITAVVTVTDDGGSSGVLRGEFEMPPPGDIRNCLVALADTEPLLEQLFQHRFEKGDGLAGHSMGNLFLAAMTQMLGFEKAVKEIGKVLAVRGEVLPVTAENVRLRAVTVHGNVIWGETNIGRSLEPIDHLALDPPDCKVHPDVLDALAQADAVVVGPGSLYTSLLPNLLVGGVVEALLKSPAKKFYVCNIMTQLGETRGFSAADHLEAINKHVGSRAFDYIIVNDRPLNAELLERYALEGAEPVKVDWERLRKLRTRVVGHNLIQSGQVAWHHPDILARLIVGRLAADLERPKRLFDLLLWEARVERMAALERKNNG